MEFLQHRMQSLQQYFDFIWAMTEKEIKSRYKRATFGFFWVVLNPLLQMLIIGFIFSFFIKIPNYYLFLFTGLLPWTFFSISLSKATPSIVYERALLQKAKFPIEAIPISIIFSNFLHMGVSMILFLTYLLFAGNVFFPQILLIIPAAVWLLFFTLGISLVSSTFQVRYRDVNFFIQTLLVLWFYATPVLYNLEIIPSKVLLLFAFNPLTSIFEIIHYSVLNRGLLDMGIIISNLVLTVFTVFVGIAVFRRNCRYFTDWL